MMEDILTNVYTLLSNDNNLILLLNGTSADNHIYNLNSCDGTVFPRVVISQMDNVPVAYADNMPSLYRFSLQIDIIDQGNDTFEIANEIIELLINNYYFCIGDAQIFDDNDMSRLFEHHLRFNKITN